MDMDTSLYEFSVFGRVDLNAVYEEWNSEPANEEYEEPRQGWALKFNYVYRNDICALLFENVSDDGTAYYRVLFFSGEGDTFGLVKKVRFKEDDSFRVKGMGVDKNLNLLFLRRSSEKVEREIYYRTIGDAEPQEVDFSALYLIVEFQSMSDFALVDGTTVLFFRAPRASSIVRQYTDPHSLQYKEYVKYDDDDDENVYWDDVDDEKESESSSEDEDEDEEENDTECHAEVKETEPKDGKTAMDELHELIGLDNIKEKVDQIVAFAKLQKMAKDRGRKVENVNLNLSFVGNPGTAKTTVARIFAHIMKENGLLSRGGLIEVGRSDLVAKYVGQTATKVKEVFEKAKGNVLFIDEAYALVDDWENEYGDEAIATIVQEMENNREDMIVIFAGYPDKMEKFLSRNPGLRSRVPFVVQFKDYTADELTAIAKSEAARRGYAVTDEAEKKIRGICEAAMKAEEFGNGRFSRNLIEAAIMRSASRTMSTLQSDADLSTFFTLEDRDFAAPENMKKEKKARVIGFCAA